MFPFPYLIELLTPKPLPDDKLAPMIERFADRYQMVKEAGCGISIPDNPMGHLRIGALAWFRQSNLAVDPERFMMNLNTYHSKEELDSILEQAAQTGLKYILVVRGDGGPMLQTINPKEIGGSLSVATSMDLLKYIHSRYPGLFITGAAYNPYNPMPFELERARQKMDSGAHFFVTQPILGRNEHVDRLCELCSNVVVEAWMSTKIDLLYRSVGIKEIDDGEQYDPQKNLLSLHSSYPGACVYLAMLSFKGYWQKQLTKL